MTTKPRINRLILFVILAAFSITALIVANTTAGKQVGLPFGFAATSGIIAIPITFIVNDVLVELYGFRRGAQVVVLSFLMNTLAVLFFAVILAVPGPVTFHDQAAFETVLSSTPRVLVSSALGFLVGSLSNAWIMNRMHIRSGDNNLFARCIVSTAAGETLDKIVFVNCAFLGVLPNSLIWTMIVTQSVIAIVYEAICYFGATKWVIKWGRTLQPGTI